MGKSYKKWWRFNDVPVEFVEPGVDPAMARRQFGYRQSWGKGRPKTQLNFETIIAIVSAIILVIGGGWWFFLRDQPVKAAENTPTATLIAYTTPTATQTAIRTPYIRVPGFTPTPTITPTPTATKTAQVLSSVLESPLSPPIQQVVVVTATPTATATRSPHAYEVIANYSQSEPMYSFISGWIVEADGSTPRPVGIEVRYPTGSMTYPRPNNKDIANGYFEFMVSPGEYDLQVLDYDAPSVHISVTENTRYEVSFRHTRPGDNIVPVRSNPWGAQFDYPQPVSTPYSPVPTPTPVSVLYLPVVFK